MKKEEKKNKEILKNKIIKFLKEIYPYVIIVVAVLLIKAYIVSPIQVKGTSMDSTLRSGDIMILQKIGYDKQDIKRFDIVVIKHQNTKIIKRIIGMPGDTIRYRNNKLYINDKLYEEDYLDEGTTTEDFSLGDLFDGSKVPEGHYFVLGDNREESMDSRTLGYIEEDAIEGKALFTIFPFSRFGVKE